MRARGRTEASGRREEEGGKADGVGPGDARLCGVRERVGDAGEGSEPAFAVVCERVGGRQVEEEVGDRRDGDGCSSEVGPLRARLAVSLQLIEWEGQARTDNVD